MLDTTTTTAQEIALETQTDLAVDTALSQDVNFNPIIKNLFEMPENFVQTLIKNPLFGLIIGGFFIMYGLKK